MNFNLREIRAFVAVVRCGTFTAASEQLHVTQPALSRRIQLIEHALGAPLFERVPGGPKLTDTGREFLPHAEAALLALEEGIDAAKGITRGERGRVVFAALGALCNSTVTDALRKFRDATPGADLTLSFHASTSDEVSEQVLEGEATLGLRLRTDSRLHSEIVGYETMLICCAPNHPLAGKNKVVPSRLYDETWITFPIAVKGSNQEFWSRLALYGLSGQDVILTDSTAAQMQLIASGFGIGLVPQGSAEDRLASGQIATIGAAPVERDVPIALISRKGAHQSGVVQRLAEHLRAAYAESRAAFD